MTAAGGESVGTAYWTGYADGRDWQARHDVDLLVQLAERILDGQQRESVVREDSLRHDMTQSGSTDRPRLRLIRGGAS